MFQGVKGNENQTSSEGCLNGERDRAKTVSLSHSYLSDATCVAMH